MDTIAPAAGGTGSLSDRWAIMVFAPDGTHRFLLEPNQELTIGRSPEAGISIEHATISREHASITNVESPTIRDLQSRNGTCVDGRRLAAGEESGTSDMGTCMALNCPRGDLVVVEATNAGSAAKLRELGFEDLSRDVFVKDTCDDAIVSVSSGFDQQFAAEALLDWANGEGVDSEYAGVGYAASTKTCGYSAIIVPATGDAGDILASKGFVSAK